MSIGDTGSAIITLLIGYPLLSGWIDFYYRPLMKGKLVAIPPVCTIFFLYLTPEILDYFRFCSNR